jgi:DnaJ-class molecular chaperone
MMTLPWAPNPNKCSECKGIGLVVRQVPCDLYTNGFATVAATCPTCLGSGRNMPLPVDVKLLAAGGER